MSFSGTRIPVLQDYNEYIIQKLYDLKLADYSSKLQGLEYYDTAEACFDQSATSMMIFVRTSWRQLSTSEDTNENIQAAVLSFEHKDIMFTHMLKYCIDCLLKS